MTTSSDPPDLFPPFQPPTDLPAWIRGKTAADLRAIEWYEPDAKTPTLLFPDDLRYRGADGNVRAEPIVWQLPNEQILLEATRAAVQFIAGKHAGKKIETPQQAREHTSDVQFDRIENAAIISLCARSPVPGKYPLAYRLNVLLGTFSQATLADAFDRLDTLRRVWDVRVHELDETQFWGVVSEIGRVGNFSPLAVLAVGSVHGFMLKAVCTLAASQTPKHLSGSPKDSTADSSPETT